MKIVPKMELIFVVAEKSLVANVPKHRLHKIAHILLSRYVMRSIRFNACACISFPEQDHNPSRPTDCNL